VTIISRSLLIDNESGLHRISDWAIVNTNLGTMFEARQERWPQGSGPDGPKGVDLDWSSEDHKITDLIFASTHEHSKMMSDGGATTTILHGGTLTPQTGR